MLSLLFFFVDSVWVTGSLCISSLDSYVYTFYASSVELLSQLNLYIGLDVGPCVEVLRF